MRSGEIPPLFVGGLKYCQINPTVNTPKIPLSWASYFGVGGVTGVVVIGIGVAGGVVGAADIKLSFAA